MVSEQQEEILTEDIVYILENPWEKSRGEWLLANESERQQTLEYLKGRLEMTKPDGFSKMWKTPDGLPIALLGAFKAGEKRFETFLICSAHMEEHSIKVSFDMRKILKELSLKYKGFSLGQYAESHRSDRISWFRFLGFQPKPEGDIGSTRYFEFVSSK